MKTRVNCNNGWEVFRCWLPQSFPKLTEGFIPHTPSIYKLFFRKTNSSMSDSAGQTNVFLNNYFCELPDKIL